MDDLGSFDVDSAGLKIYTCEDEPEGESLKEKCRCLVEQAMKSLLPEETVESVRLFWSDFLKPDLLKSVDSCIKKHSDDQDSTKLAELKKKRDSFKEMLRYKKFREYYTLLVDLVPNKNYLVVVSKDLKEVVVTTDKYELLNFVDSLGPDYVVVYKFKKDLCREVISEFE